MPDENIDENSQSNENSDGEEKIITDEVEVEKKSNSNSKIHGPSIVYGGIITAVIVLIFSFGGELIQPIEKEIVEESIIEEESNDKLTLDTFFANTSPVLGNPNAPLVLIEFGDYQCHFCNVFFQDTEHEIIKNYVATGKVKILFKDFTIIGPDSVSASHIAHCAGEQGKFWEYHDILYNNWNGENNGWASKQNLLKFAKEIDLDMEQLIECDNENRYQTTIESSNNDARVLGLTGTPAFYIISNNDIQRLFGAQEYEIFEEVFESMLEK
mgnify:CR=1 FL=1|tara:strand:- start:100 stop:909 length:810 start_codon:yes stop_codon:yes gene_type:complete